MKTCYNDKFAMNWKKMVVIEGDKCFYINSILYTYIKSMVILLSINIDCLSLYIHKQHDNACNGFVSRIKTSL